jgi:hypothetical protein
MSVEETSLAAWRMAIKKNRNKRIGISFDRGVQYASKEVYQCD